MLEVISLSHQFPRKGDGPRCVLDSVSCRAPAGHLLGILGARGSGKSVLLRLLSGQERVQAGAILWNGRDIGQQPLPANAIGVVAANEAALQPLMSVKEHIVCALMLGVGGWEKREFLVRADKLMALCGIDSVAGQRVESITTPQRRRLLLAIAIATEPQIIVCDGFTDDLDAKSERELGALLQAIAKAHPSRVVINATSTLGNLAIYDTVITLHEGRVCFHGPARAITHYFSIPHIEELYHRLAMRPVQRWQDSWSRHRDSYYAAFKLASGNGSSEAELGTAAEDDDTSEEQGRLRLAPTKKQEARSEKSGEEQVMEILPPAALGTQMGVLMRRRMTVLRRSRAEWWTQIAMIVGAPLACLIVLGPQVKALQSMRAAGSAGEALGAFVSGFFLLQVLLVIAMALRTSVRELAEERIRWQREHRAGLRPFAYMMSKAMFLLPLLLAQSIPMGLLAEGFTGGLPGNGPVRVVILVLTSVAFAALSLGISAWSSTADRAAARGWLLAFAQALLTGAIVLLPGAIASLLHPFITAYYGWSGCMDSMKGTALFDAALRVNNTWFATPAGAMIMLLLHVVSGLILVLTGLRKTK